MWRMPPFLLWRTSSHKQFVSTSLPHQSSPSFLHIQTRQVFVLLSLRVLFGQSAALSLHWETQCCPLSDPTAGWEWEWGEQEQKRGNKHPVLGLIHHSCSPGSPASRLSSSTLDDLSSDVTLKIRRYSNHAASVTIWASDASDRAVRKTTVSVIGCWMSLFYMIAIRGCKEKKTRSDSNERITIWLVLATQKGKIRKTSVASVFIPLSCTQCL